MTAGADFAYLFNYMRSNVTNYNDPNDSIMYSDLYKWDNYQHLLRNAGEIDTAMKCIRRHIPTFQDCTPIWKNTYCPFPNVCKSNDYYVNVRIRTGLVPKGAKATLILGCDPVDNKGGELPLGNFEVWINAHQLFCSERIKAVSYTHL